MTTATRLTPSEMLTAIDSCRPLAMKLAKRFRATNPGIPLPDLFDTAVFGLKLAAIKYDPSRGNKFITVAYRYAFTELIQFCRVESARGMHVPEDHKPYYAPAPKVLAEDWQHPVTTDSHDELGEDFWRSVVRTLDARDARVILRVWRDGLDQKEAGAELGISRARAQQLHQRAMERLKGREDLRALARAVA